MSPQDGKSLPDDQRNGNVQQQRGTKDEAATSSPQRRSILTVPAPVKRIFDSFPLLSYPANSPPLSCEDNRSKNILFVHATREDAAVGAPSLHPGCLKWQTLLRIYNIPFELRASNTHASPSSTLPFLLPSTPTSTTLSTRDPVTFSTLPAWIRSNSSTPARAPMSSLHESLLRPIRAAYLHAVYLTPVVFARKTKPLYINTATSVSVVRDALAWQLRDEAVGEITSSSGAVWPRIDADALYGEAEDSIEALGVILGDSRWFGRRKDAEEVDTSRDSLEDEGLGNWEVPGMLDAGVFGYTHVLLEMLDEDWEGSEGETELALRLVAALRSQENLISHRDRVLRHYYS